MARKRLPGLAATGLLLCGCLLPAGADAQTAAHQWSAGYGSALSDYGCGVAVDGTGNVFAAGYFWQSVSFGGASLTSAGSTDVFIAKYSPDGTHVWSRRGGGTDTDQALAIAVDSAGNVIVVGTFYGTADFGGGSRISAGSNDVFAAKYSASGTHLWSQRFGDTGGDAAYAVAVDPNDNIYVTGSFAVKIDFGGGTLSSAGSSDIFVAKFDAGGAHLWSQRFGGTSSDIGRAIACRGTSAVTLAGSFQATANFGGGNLTSAGGEDVFVVDLTHTGTHRWGRRFGGSSSDYAFALAVDPAGPVLLAGSFNGTVDFGGGNLASAGFSDIFLAKYDDTGQHAWSRRFGGSSYDAGNGLACDADGNVLLAGYFSATADFGGGTVTSAGSVDFFVARYDAVGACRWCRQAGGAGEDAGRAVAAAGTGAAVVTGNFTTSIDFGGGTRTSAGGNDVFVARFGPYSNEPVITAITDVGNDQGRRVNVRLERSGFDAAGSPSPVYSYEVYRRDDPPPAPSMVKSAVKSAGDCSGLTRLQLLDLGWTFVGEMPAHGQPSYAMDVATIGDSTVSQGQYLSTFFVRAATASPVTYFDSPSAQGYSLDNLAPGVPGGLLYGAGALAWDPAAADDFDYFVVYGSGTASFDDAVIIDTTTAPGLDVSSSPYPHYFVTAVDFAGNESGPATADATSAVADLPPTPELSIACHPNPFNPLTSISYAVPQAGRVTVEICDARGVRVTTLLDGEVRAAGNYRQEWNGRGDSGRPVPSGVYFAHVRQDGAARTVKITLVR
jgi:hypothetical protein